MGKNSYDNNERKRIDLPLLYHVKKKKKLYNETWEKLFFFATEGAVFLYCYVTSIEDEVVSSSQGASVIVRGLVQDKVFMLKLN